MANKKKLYRFHTENQWWFGTKEHVNNLPSDFKKKIWDCIEKSSQGESVPKLIVPAQVLKEAGWFTEQEMMHGPEKEPAQESLPPSEKAGSPTPASPLVGSSLNKTFVDQLADKIAERLNKNLASEVAQKLKELIGL